MIFRAPLMIALCMVASMASAQAPDIENMDLVERATPDGPVARVRGSSISRGAFLYLYRTQLAEVARMQRTVNVSDDTRVRTALATLADLVRREIIWQEGKARGLSAPEAEVSRRYRQQMDRLREYLSRTAGKDVTEADILARAGQPKDQALEQIRKTIIVRETSEAIAREKGIEVTDGEVAAFYRENPDLFRKKGGCHLKHILVIPKPSAKEASEAAWEAARKRIEKARARMRAGESFEAVARDMSDSPRAAEGGDLGMQVTSQLPKVYADAVKHLSPGETSDILKDEHGYHILRLEEVEDESNITLDEAREKIRKLLLAEKRERAVDAFVQPIVADPKQVRVFLQLERTLAGMAPPQEKTR